MPVNSFENYPMSWKPTLTLTQNPLYLSLAMAMEEDIQNGVLLPGTKLPPQRELADYLDLNLSTITRAFKVCEKKGLFVVSLEKERSFLLMPLPKECFLRTIILSPSLIWVQLCPTP